MFGNTGIEVIDDAIAATLVPLPAPSTGLEVIDEATAAAAADAVKKCQWYEERKTSGSVVACQFPSTTVVIMAAAAVVGFIVLGRT
jgi:hypothetical protein